MCVYIVIQSCTALIVTGISVEDTAGDGRSKPTMTDWVFG